MNQKKVKLFQEKLLGWYDKHARELPWRAKKGEISNPYHVWLSEIMLQQTTIATVKDYFEKFIRMWPTLKDFSQASEDEILAAWSGLGYYSRARNLKKTANILHDDYNDRLPEDYDSLIKLPGIGDYTASAIRSIAFNKDAVVMDGNVERVVSRIFKLDDKLPKAKPIFKEKTAILSHDPKDRHGDFAQAMMDLGSTICTVQAPKCLLCPVSNECKAFELGAAEEYPKKEKKKAKPKRYANAYFIHNEEGAFLMRKRPEKGLLANMYEIPTTLWLHDKKELIEPSNDIMPRFATESIDIKFKKKKGAIKHVFTHFEFYITVYVAVTEEIEVMDGIAVNEQEIHKYGVPTVMKKIIKHALSDT